ncbi:MAG: metalloregulator ArsR/SmtB family transcription factor [Actinomycetota bacterium]|nr:metalloregulator ArsR/SmtB family transcription factor [Actinomycetota bacterium]
MAGEVFRALSDPTRRRLLDVLRRGPATTGTLAASFPTTRFAVMKHLQVLVDAGLVTVERRGRERWNHLDPVPLRLLYERWLAPYAENLAVTALSLKRAAEQPDPQEDQMTVTDLPAGLGSLDVRAEIRIAAQRGRVFQTLTEMGTWWPHRFRPGSDVVFEARVGGRFYEDWGDGDGALYGVVQQLEQDSLVHVAGPMGVRGPVASVWSMTLEDAAEGTLVTLAHRAFGDIDAASQQMYAEGWTAILSLIADRSTG